FERRTQLPAPTCETEVSFLSILRKNIGKDLSTVSMPVALNEPINLLQKLCEELEYSELLDRASEQADSLERLLYIAAFVVSGYASTQYRSTRKPFNPLHGETYECVREDKGFRFISEKVSHNPPIMACHAESDNFVFHQDSKLKSKFWGKSMELSPSGTVHITLPKWQEQYTYCKPATWMRNMLAGNRYLEHSGEVRVQNHTTGEYCLLNFKEGGMFSASTNEVVGVVYNAKGKKVHTINGRWTEIMYHEREKNQLNVLWRAEPPPHNHESQYGFTTFTVQLNELTPDLQAPGVLPCTDTRLRPDQRAYEAGRIDEADTLKASLENAQRERRRQMEEAGASWQTQWFVLKPHPNCKEPCWQYTGGYWEAR
ncbi:Oxysterol-binding protein, partial [Syncephalis pseudoplumigaleata]